MAFRASSLITSNGYASAKGLALRAKSAAEASAADFSSSTASDRVLQCYQSLRQIRDELVSVKSIPGIVAYAQDQEADATYDVAAEFTALIAALDSVFAEIESTFPTTGAGYLEERKLTAQGTYEYRTFSPGALSTLRGLLGNVASAVS